MRIGYVVVLLSSCALIARPSSTLAQATTRESVDSAGAEANADCQHSAISADGRFVAFQSRASNLVSDDTNGALDVFVRDRLTGELALVSRDSTGAVGDGASAGPAISADGRHVVFRSDASLVPNDVNGWPDVYVLDRLTGETSLASPTTVGNQMDNGCDRPSISADGRFIVYCSYEAGIVPGDTNGTSDVFVFDRQTGVTSCESLDTAGNPSNGRSISGRSAISANGRFVAFSSVATNLVVGDTNGFEDVFVRDRRTGITTRIGAGPSGDPPNGESRSASISADGRHVAFESSASNFVPGDTNGTFDVFVFERRSGLTFRVSVTSEGVEASGSSFDPFVSTDGRFVAFTSNTSDLVPGDGNGRVDVFVHDRSTGETELTSVDTFGAQANRKSGLPSISADGRFVGFNSGAGNLVAGDTNGAIDVFVRDRAACRAGNVSGGTDVLFVNDSSGGADRTVRLLADEPLTIFVAAPPSASGLAPFALYAWLYEPVPGAPAFTLPFAIGETCLPTPLTGGLPAPRVVWNNTRSSLAGIPTHASSPAPSIIVQLSRGLRRPGSAFLQGIIRDRTAPNGRAAVTNGLTIEVR